MNVAIHPLPQLKGGTKVHAIGDTSLLSVERICEDDFDASAIYDLNTGHALLGSESNGVAVFIFCNDETVVRMSDHEDAAAYHAAVRAQFDATLKEVQEEDFSLLLPDELVED